MRTWDLKKLLIVRDSMIKTKDLWFREKSKDYLASAFQEGIEFMDEQITRMESAMNFGKGAKK